MKKIILIATTAFLFTPSCYAQEIELQEAKTKLQAPQNIQKDKTVQITPQESLPIYGKATGICFEIGKPLPFKTQGDNPKEKIKNLLIQTFGDKETQDPYKPGSQFIEGFIKTDKDQIINFNKSRVLESEIVLEGVIFENKRPVVQPYQISVCAMLESPAESVKYIEFKSLSNFSTTKTYWSTSNIMEITNSPPR